MGTTQKSTWSVVTGFAASMLFAATVMAAEGLAGTWSAVDGTGRAFEITLSEDGSASATQGEGLSGTWKDDGGTAVISWSTGWSTKIAKDGDGYKKTAYAKGADLAGEPTNTSAAKKVK